MGKLNVSHDCKPTIACISNKVTGVMHMKHSDAFFLMLNSNWSIYFKGQCKLNDCIYSGQISMITYLYSVPDVGSKATGTIFDFCMSLKASNHKIH